MADFRRKRRHLSLPIWSSVVLMTINIALMTVLIVQLVQQSLWLALALGSVALAISLFGMSLYSFLTIKEIQLNRRQSNFVDSVTHELKTPIAALRLYLDTLIMREPDAKDRQEFYGTMNSELTRLDELINQLLEVARLDAVGHQREAEAVQLEDMLRSCAEAACLHHKQEVSEVFHFEISPLALTSRRMLLEMIFGNLLDNAVKYGGRPPRVTVHAFARGRDRVVVRVRDNGPGVAPEDRRRIFQLFFRGSDELQRTKTGTGLGLYIVRTLVGMLKGRVAVVDAESGAGSVFEVTLPGRQLEIPESENRDGRQRVSELALSGKEKTP
ncbi:MAG TPA: HAMP domain-containing sensor histidine kinase [Planctomycetaceae bacterium]|nr:HAMP domain-containing sensor histidine kinase [Planctomycetaceae bacterium]